MGLSGRLEASRIVTHGFMLLLPLSLVCAGILPSESSRHVFPHRGQSPYEVPLSRSMAPPRKHGNREISLSQNYKFVVESSAEGPYIEGTFPPAIRTYTVS